MILQTRDNADFAPDQVDRREYDRLLSENALYLATIRNLVASLERDKPSPPDLEQSLAAAKQVLAVHT